LRYRGAVLAFAATVVFAAVAGAATLFLDFYGYDYWNPSGCYNAVGYVPSADPTYLNFDYVNNEYTFHVAGACIAQAETLGTFVIASLSGGTFNVYRDPLLGGTMANYGTNPPNATSPNTFADGECVIGADFTSLMLYFDLSTGTGSLEGTMDLVRGTQLGNIPPHQRMGWTLAGLRQFATPGNPVPVGYSWQIDGSLYIEDPIAQVHGGGIDHAQSLSLHADCDAFGCPGHGVLGGGSGPHEPCGGLRGCQLRAGGDADCR
jgi:hypothetical protein